MIILSKYSVLEYLLWIKNNKYKGKVSSNLSFYGLASSENILNTQVLDISVSTRNSVFEFLVDNDHYIFKQFGPDLEKREKYFLSETVILNQKFAYIPEITFQDDLNNIVISRKLIGYEDFGIKLKKLYEKYKDSSIKGLLTNLAKQLIKIHSVTALGVNANVPKYNSSLWRHFFIDKPEFDSFYVEFLSLWKDSCLTHFDLHGKNILIAEDGDIKVIDWEMSEIGDPYYDLCSIIRIICIVMINPYFLSFKLPSDVNEVKKFINIFLNAYSNVNKDKLKLFFKIHNYDLFNAKYYLNNIELLLS